jgi:hypothetical protein
MPPGPPPTTQQVVWYESRASLAGAGIEAMVESGTQGTLLLLR